MSGEVTPMHEHVYAAIQAINALVEQCEPAFAHQGISIVRQHLENRAAQTAPESLDPDEDLL
jgi:hypothetical protein